MRRNPSGGEVGGLLPEVAGHHARAADLQLAVLGDAHLGLRRDRRAAGDRAPLGAAVLRGVREQRLDLGRAVAHVGGRAGRVGGVHDRARVAVEGGEAGLAQRRVGRGLQQPQHHRVGAVGVRDAVARDRAPPPRGVEGLLEDDGRAAGQRAERAVVAEHAAQRQHRQRHASGAS